MNRIFRVLRSCTIIKNKIEVMLFLLNSQPGEDIVFKLNNGLKLKVPRTKGNKSIFYTIEEIFKKLIYLVEVSPPQVVIDLGAQIGGFSLYALDRCPGSVVYSLEPDPENYKYLLENIKINNVEKYITPINMAAYSDNMPILFNRSEDSTRAGSIYYAGNETIEVMAITLNELFRIYSIDKCDILKIDIEGAEYDVMYSCPSEVLNRINKIYMECHIVPTKPQHNITDMKKYLVENGFNIVCVKDCVITAIRA